MGVPAGCPGFRSKNVSPPHQAVGQQVPPGCERFPILAPSPALCFVLVLQAPSLASEPAFPHSHSLTGLWVPDSKLEFHSQGAEEPRVHVPFRHPAAQACVPHNSHERRRSTSIDKSPACLSLLLG